jgi:putative transposase
MASQSYSRHRFPPPIIQHAIWLYLRFTLSYRDVEDLLAERGRHRPRPSDRWHLDEMVVRIAGQRM